MNELLLQENKEPDIPTENFQQDITEAADLDTRLKWITEKFNLNTETTFLETENANPEIENISLETENTSLETENASLEIENLSLETESVSLETENLNLEIEESNHISNVTEKGDLNNTVLTGEENIPNGLITNCDKLEPITNLNCNNEIEENVFESKAVPCSSKDLNTSSSRDQDFVVLFEEKLFLNGEPCATSSPTDKKKCETLLQNAGNL